MPKKNPLADYTDRELGNLIEQPDNPMFGSHISEKTEKDAIRLLKQRGYSNDQIGKMSQGTFKFSHKPKPKKAAKSAKKPTGKKKH